MNMGDPAESTLRVSREYGDTIPLAQLKVADMERMDKYERPITDDERISFGEKVVHLSATVEDNEEEKKAQSAMYNENIKKAKSERRDLLRIMKRSRIEIADTIYTYLDHDRLTVHEYNSEGVRVNERRMRPEERAMLPFGQQQ